MSQATFQNEEYPVDSTSNGRTANAIIEALGQFFICPSTSNKVAAVVAMQVYLTEVEQHVRRVRPGGKPELATVSGNIV